LGVKSAQGLEDRPLQAATRLALLPPGPLTIRAVDVEGKAIGGIELSLAVRTADSDWIVAREIAESNVRTDAAGTATVPWAPREKLKIVNVEIMSPDWKIDETDLGRISEGIATVHASRRRRVEGRLVMPEAPAPRAC
jgi:hypothetical protein